MHPNEHWNVDLRFDWYLPWLGHIWLYMRMCDPCSNRLNVKCARIVGVSHHTHSSYHITLVWPQNGMLCVQTHIPISMMLAIFENRRLSKQTSIILSFHWAKKSRRPDSMSITFIFRSLFMRPMYCPCLYRFYCTLKSVNTILCSIFCHCSDCVFFWFIQNHFFLDRI